MFVLMQVDVGAWVKPGYYTDYTVRETASWKRRPPGLYSKVYPACVVTSASVNRLRIVELFTGPRLYIWCDGRISTIKADMCMSTHAG